MWVTVTERGNVLLGMVNKLLLVHHLFLSLLHYGHCHPIRLSFHESYCCTSRHGRHRLVTGQGEPKQPHRARLDMWADFALSAAGLRVTAWHRGTCSFCTRSMINIPHIFTQWRGVVLRQWVPE